MPTRSDAFRSSSLGVGEQFFTSAHSWHYLRGRMWVCIFFFTHMHNIGIQMMAENENSVVTGDLLRVPLLI